MKTMIKTVCIFFLCFATIFSSISSAITNSDNVSSLDEISFFDVKGNLVEVLEESDGTIVVYINGKLDHSAKTDLTSGTVISTKYRNPEHNKVRSLTSEKVLRKKNLKEDKIGMIEETTTYKIDELVKEVKFKMNDKPVFEEEGRLDPTSSLLSFPPTWPYNEGYAYRDSYNNVHVDVIAHGYYRDEGPTYTATQQISFLRTVTIGTAVALLISALGGPITVSVATGAIVGAVGSALIDGAFQRDVDVNAYYKIEWERWLAIVNGNNYYTQQGTRYVRVLNQSGPGESTRLVEGKVGFIHNFTEFLRQSSWN